MISQRFGLSGCSDEVSRQNASPFRGSQVVSRATCGKLLQRSILTRWEWDEMRRLIPPSSDCSYEPAIGRLFQPALSALLLSAFQSPRLYRKLHQQPLQPTCSKWQDNILQGRHRCIPDFDNCRCYKYRNIECLFPLYGIWDMELEPGGDSPSWAKDCK